LIEINNKPHLWSIEKIQKSLIQSKLTLDDIYQSFLRTVSISEPFIKAWEVYDKKLLTTSKSKPLTGVLIGVKDNINTKDFPTKMGTVKAWSANFGGFDARLISNLKYQGCQIVGKTKTSELAVHLPVDTINPLYPDSIVGTSSSGSAAAVAAGHVAITIGTQTAGSIARPASFCGVVGFKPSFGDIPRTGILKTTEKFDQVGFFGARVSDLLNIYNIAKVSGRDHPIHEARRRNINKLDKLVVLDYSSLKYVDKKLVINFNRFLLDIASRYCLDLVYISPLLLEQIRDLHNFIYVSELKTYLKDEIREASVSDNLKNFLNKYTSASKDEVNKYENRIHGALDVLLSNHPNAIFCSLAAQFSAPKIGSHEGKDFNFAWTAFGFPQIVLPLLKDDLNKTVGLSLSAQKGADIQLLNFAEKLMPESIYDLIFK
jgi:Asp-tRNA(Asn)/Glu-tRNA(Gln) amidotransferase A subunit family amidase